MGERAQMNKSFNNRVSFISWLSSNCPNNISPQDILKSLDEGSERSLRLRYSDKSFWEMSSVEEYTRTTEKLLSSLKWSKLLFLRKKASALLEKSIELYKHFLSEKNTVKNCYVDSSKRVVEGERSFPTIDRTEAIYLIDKYLDTIAHKGDWVSIANDTSRLFRNRALKFDMAIDEEFRNVPFVEECFSDIATGTK